MILGSDQQDLIVQAQLIIIQSTAYLYSNNIKMFPLWWGLAPLILRKIAYDSHNKYDIYVEKWGKSSLQFINSNAFYGSKRSAILTCMASESNLLSYAEHLGPYIALFKTHIDIIFRLIMSQP